ncbi:DUF1134 domain-containing protein [Sphingorhabdus arenilitoris]|uniref:DUF1134 domain-containing protein n=1 Tax=Sphingorhabdus arenilitoris TaxID=1490041 RepID=A0ABV8RL90_9SPHN
MSRKSKTSFWTSMMLAISMMMSGAIVAAPASAQLQSVDPNDAIGQDAGDPPSQLPPEEDTVIRDGVPTEGVPPQGDYPGDAAPGTESLPNDPSPLPSDPNNTYQKDDLIGAAEGLFGKGAEGLGGIIESILKKQGQPNAYIVGREGGGAFIVGLRYGSGTLYHKVEGEKKAYWTGPSIGFDAGANAGSTFILVYNLYDSEDLYKRFPSAEGVAYLVGGFNASYLRRGDVVLIPVRVGAGLRLGANVGYMKFSKKQRWLPF